MLGMVEPDVGTMVVERHIQNFSELNFIRLDLGLDLTVELVVSVSWDGVTTEPLPLVTIRSKFITGHFPRIGFLEISTFLAHHVVVVSKVDVAEGTLVVVAESHLRLLVNLSIASHHVSWNTWLSHKVWRERLASQHSQLLSWRNSVVNTSFVSVV
jgi:hypothetical protein